MIGEGQGDEMMLSDAHNFGGDNMCMLDYNSINIIMHAIKTHIYTSLDEPILKTLAIVCVFLVGEKGRL